MWIVGARSLLSFDGVWPTGPYSSLEAENASVLKNNRRYLRVLRTCHYFWGLGTTPLARPSTREKVIQRGDIHGRSLFSTAPAGSIPVRNLTGIIVWRGVACGGRQPTRPFHHSRWAAIGSLLKFENEYLFLLFSYIEKHYFTFIDRSCTNTLWNVGNKAKL